MGVDPSGKGADSRQIKTISNMWQPAQPSPTLARADMELIGLAAQCVKCGLCLPHCPTYRLAQEEGESPRGRVSLIGGWARGALPSSPRLNTHLERCLGCRACEAACPSLVPFGRLMDIAKARRVRQWPWWRRWLHRTRLAAIRDRRLQWVIGYGGLLYRRSGLAGLIDELELSRWSRLHRYHRLATVVRAGCAAAEPDPASPSLRLLGSCVDAIAQPAARAAAMRVLKALGHRAAPIDGAHCCGALCRHQGLIATADEQLQRLVAAIDGRPVVGIASACIAELREHAGATSAADICTFLANLDWPSALRCAPLPCDILVHEPCTHRNRLHDTRAIYRLLERIPEARIGTLAGGSECCGAAGTYMLDQPRLSQALLAQKLASLRESPPTILVTTNPGCALHLAAGVREARLAIELCHPIELIDRQLRATAGTG